MNSIPIWVYIFIAIMLVIGIWWRVTEPKRKKARKELLHELALKRNGKVEDVKEKHLFEGPTTYSKLILSHSGYKNIEIYTKYEAERGDFTCAKASFQLSKDVKIKLYKRRGVSKLFRRDIQTGNPEFDDVFAITASDKNFGRGFFTPKVQHKLLSLKKREPSLRITQTELALEIFSAPDSIEYYDNFIETTLSLFESLQRQEMLK